MKSILSLIIIVSICFGLPGCVNRQLAESYGQFLDTAGAEYIEYVDQDPALDETDRSIRRANYDQARQTVEKFKSTKWSW